MNRQIRQLGGALVILFIILFVQLNNTQVLRAEKLAEDPRNNRTAVRDFSTPRGFIQTSDGVVIAESKEVDDGYKQLRTYPKGELFGHITGFFSFTYGNEGLERTYNDQLTGRSIELKKIDDLLTERVRANNLTITITNRLQQVAKDQLGDKRGSIVAYNPKTGEILAMYSNPSFDPTPLSAHNFPEVTKARASLVADKSNPMLPRAYRETYAPGSTFKVITSSAAFDRKPELTTKKYPVLTELDLPLTNRNLRNFGGNDCGGDIVELLRVSCNTGFAQMGIDMGGDNLAGEANSFGFNSVPPLDLPSVAKSRFPAADKFRRNPPALAYSAIGQQDVAATPLQMALSAGAIANGGVIVKPRLLKEIRSTQGEVMKSGKSEPWIRATSPATADEVKQLMINVAERGTAVGARVPGVTVAAKTGTAETGNGKVHAWIVAFAPAEDPQIALAVILENQPGVSESTGGRLAAPIAKELIKNALGK